MGISAKVRMIGPGQSVSSCPTAFRPRVSMAGTNENAEDRKESMIFYMTITIVLHRIWDRDTTHWIPGFQSLRDQSRGSGSEAARPRGREAGRHYQTRD